MGEGIKSILPFLPVPSWRSPTGYKISNSQTAGCVPAQGMRQQVHRRIEPRDADGEGIVTRGRTGDGLPFEILRCKLDKLTQSLSNLVVVVPIILNVFRGQAAIRQSF